MENLITNKIKHLEKCSQEQLIVLVNLIRKHTPKCSMIVLFGSYARGEGVIYDEHPESGGGRVSFQSDYDIMVVLAKPATKAKAYEINRKIYDKVASEYNKIYEGTLYAPPQFVVECEGVLCKQLEEHQPFYSDVMREGIMLYDDGRVILPAITKLSYSLKGRLAQEYFDYACEYANNFLIFGNTGYNDKKYVIASFLIHQACEKYYRILSMSFINYHSKLHDLEKLIDMTKSYSPELSTVFPRVTEFEQNTFNLLRDAYVDARYKIDFKVTKEELEYMLERTEVLKEITTRICKEQIKHYETLAKDEE